MSIVIFIGFNSTALIIFHHFGKIRLSRLYFSIIGPLWCPAAMLMIGGNFSQSIAATVLLTITYVLFDKERVLRVKLIAYNIFLYVIPATYLSYNPPLFGIRNHPLDEVLVYLISLGWIFVMLFFYQRERENLIDTLQAKNDDLEKATEELERFTYIASHDLKSPIRTIVSFLGLIERNLKSEKYEDALEYLVFAKEGASQMHNLIQDILEFSRTRDDAEKTRDWVDLNHLVSKVMTNLRQDIAEREAFIQFPDLPQYMCHESEFLVVFQNIIQNAMKYNDKPIPTINIYTKKTDHHFIISIEDNGIGIEKQYFGKVFEFFKRLHNQETYKGTGLGLALCKKIIQSYDGDISIESEPGVGSTFSIELPLENMKETERRNDNTVSQPKQEMELEPVLSF